MSFFSCFFCLSSRAVFFFFFYVMNRFDGFEMRVTIPKRTSTVSTPLSSSSHPARPPSLPRRSTSSWSSEPPPPKAARRRPSVGGGGGGEERFSHERETEWSPGKSGGTRLSVADQMEKLGLGTRDELERELERAQGRESAKYQF